MKFLILIVLIIGILIRFLYFPDNVYFSFDQARDSFTALEILRGDFKLVGPPSFLSNKLFPGPLIFYIYAPIYFLFDKNPEAVSVFLRFFNSFGIILTFLLGVTIFNKKVGLISAILFAISYEQTQYALFMSHQPLAVIPILIFYLGLALIIFKKNSSGLLLTTLGWGTSIQFHYGYLLLSIPLFVIFLFFRKDFYIIKFKDIILSVIILFLTLSTFFITELKYHFFSSYIFQDSSNHLSLHPKETLYIINRFIHDIFIANYSLTPFIIILGIILIIIAFVTIKDQRPKFIFLIIWFFGGLIPYLISGVPSYYYSASASVGLLIFFSYLITKLLPKYLFLALALILVVIINNLSQIISINKTGVNSDMVIQAGMLTVNQKKTLDYMYIQANNKPFAINALTIPLQVNTTWSYLFEWYGKAKYGYLPTFGGNAAEGYPGNLKVIKIRSSLSNLQFLIIEPTTGIRESFIDNFLREENYFTKIIEEKKFGTIKVQKRQKI